MTHILEQEWLTTADVSLLPGLGVLESRADAQLRPWIYSAPMESVTGYDLAKEMLRHKQIPVISRFISQEERLRCINELDKDWMIIAIGLDEIEKICAGDWITDESLSFAIDVAHGDTLKVHKLTTMLYKHRQARGIMSGSVCTEEGALRAADAGCNLIRVGVGPGSMCTTRIQTGVGAPNLSAVYRISNAVYNHGMFPAIIADGGIKSPGDAVKYIAAGAYQVMLGSELSKAEEAPGWELDGKTQEISKLYRGQASQSFQESLFGKSSYIEGASKSILWEGDTVESIIQTYNNGMRSALSYLGLTHIADISPSTTQMIKITNNGYIEGTPHGL